ncbi:MAG: hypothetical protein LBB88_10625 [Planctomycetaceae bacterium]|nr:hypothetical protein [Planctomycetaceae bacterium]
MGGHWGQRGRWGHWGRTNLKTMINDSTENNSLFKREKFFSLNFVPAEPSIPDFKQERPQCPQRPLCPQRPPKK